MDFMGKLGLEEIYECGPKKQLKVPSTFSFGFWGAERLKHTFLLP